MIKKAILSEKSLKMAKAGFFTFIVERLDRKEQIAKFIAKRFNVDVISIKSANFKPEIKRQRRSAHRFEVAGYKKMVVQLKAGQKIPLFELEEGKQEVVSDGEREATVEVKEKKSLLKGTKIKIEREEK